MILLSAKVERRLKIFTAVRFSLTGVTIGITSTRMGMSYTDDTVGNMFWFHFFGSLQCFISFSIYNYLGSLQHRKARARSSQNSSVGGTVEEAVHSSPLATAVPAFPKVLPPAAGPSSVPGYNLPSSHRIASRLSHNSPPPTPFIQQVSC